MYGVGGKSLLGFGGIKIKISVYSCSTKVEEWCMNYECMYELNVLCCCLCHYSISEDDDVGFHILILLSINKKLYRIKIILLFSFCLIFLSFLHANKK